MEQDEKARRILNRYYSRLAKQMVEEIVENEREFDLVGIGRAEDIIERYAHRLIQLCQVRSSLSKPAPREKPVGKTPLGKDEFRCFACGDVIRRQDEQCTKCGWTWRA